jgi:hypothetical protein
MMHQSDDILGTQQLDYEAWRDLLRSMSGRYNPEGIEPKAFAGWGLFRANSAHAISSAKRALQAEGLSPSHLQQRRVAAVIAAATSRSKFYLWPMTATSWAVRPLS